MLTMHLKLLTDDVVLQYLATPQSTKEQMLGPHRTYRKFLHPNSLIKDIHLLKLIEEHLKMQRSRDDQATTLIGSVIHEDDSSAITT